MCGGPESRRDSAPLKSSEADDQPSPSIFRNGFVAAIAVRRAIASAQRQPWNPAWRMDLAANGFAGRASGRRQHPKPFQVCQFAGLPQTAQIEIVLLPPPGREFAARFSAPSAQARRSAI